MGIANRRSGVLKCRMCNVFEVSHNKLEFRSWKKLTTLIGGRVKIQFTVKFTVSILQLWLYSFSDSTAVKILTVDVAK